MDQHKTYMRFVMFGGEVLAVFMRSSAELRTVRMHDLPYVSYMTYRACYAHVGQHAECYDGMQRRKRATKEQYTPLLNELKSIGYNVSIM